MHMSMLQQHARSICAPAAKRQQHTTLSQAALSPCRAQQAFAGLHAAPLQSAAAVVHHQQHHRQRVLQPVQQQLGRLHHPAWICRSSLASQATPEPIPDGERMHMSHGQQLHMLCSCFLAGFGSCLQRRHSAAVSLRLSWTTASFCPISFTQETPPSPGRPPCSCSVETSMSCMTLLPPPSLC